MWSEADLALVWWNLVCYTVCLHFNENKALISSLLTLPYNFLSRQYRGRHSQSHHVSAIVWIQSPTLIVASIIAIVLAAVNLPLDFSCGEGVEIRAQLQTTVCSNDSTLKLRRSRLDEVQNPMSVGLCYCSDDCDISDISDNIRHALCTATYIPVKLNS